MDEVHKSKDNNNRIDLVIIYRHFVHLYRGAITCYVGAAPGISLAWPLGYEFSEFLLRYCREDVSGHFLAWNGVQTSGIEGLFGEPSFFCFSHFDR